MFEPIFSEQVIEFIAKIAKKNKILARAINRKIKEILSRDTESVQYYKNLSHELGQFKRVHITQNLVLAFEVDLNKNKILFAKIGHRKDIYKKLV